MQTRANLSELDEQLSAYFDDELDEAARASIEAQLEQDPEIAARLADLLFMRTMVVGDLEHQAERVPEARFEQLWDSFENTLERESRLQEAAEAPPKWWERLREWARPVRVPLAAAAAVGALAFVIARSVGAPSDDAEAELVANTQDEAASDGESDESKSPAPTIKRGAPGEPGPAKTNDQIAVAPSPAPVAPDAEVFPQPEPGEAEIRRIEFGGQMGTISQIEGTRGTTTVIWVTEDEDPVDSERSL
jgi:negative regulator of sigma E activity